MILIDSNVIVASIVDHHASHTIAASFINAPQLPPLIVAAHSYAEAYVTMTRRGGPQPYALDQDRATAGLAAIRAVSALVAMTAEETFDAIGRFAQIGIGARLYDYLIGRTGLLHGAQAIVTFNTGHMRALFPQVAVHTPGEWLALNPAPPPPP